MATLKEWNEGLAKHFLTPSGTHCLAMENSTIEAIGEELGVDRGKAIEDFLKSMLSTDIGYGNKDGVDNLNLQDFDGTKESAARIFKNSKKIRDLYKSHVKAARLHGIKDGWKYPDDVMPWLSHLALIILSSSTNIGRRPPNSRYLPILDYVSHYLLRLNRIQISDDVEKRFKKVIGDNFFPDYNIIYYDIIQDDVENTDSGKIWRYDHWTFLHKWSSENKKFEGKFVKTGGNVQFAVPKHLFLRDKDRTYIYKIFNDSGINRSIPLDESWLINKIKSDSVKIYEWSPGVQSALERKRNETIQELAEFMSYLWKADNFDKESKERLKRNNKIIKYPHLKRTYFFAPYLYIDKNLESMEILSKPYQVRLHKNIGNVMDTNEVIEVKGKKFIFERDNEVSEPVDVDNEDIYFNDDEVIEIEENGEVIATVSPLMHLLSNGRGRKFVITKDEYGMYGHNSERQLSKGYQLFKIQNRSSNNLTITILPSSQLRLTDQIGLKKKDAELENSSRTKINIEGGVKISKNHYTFNGKKSFPKMRLHSGKKEDVKFFPRGGWESYFEEEPNLGEDTEGIFWSFNPKISGGQGNVIEIKIIYKYSYEEKNNEIQFNLHIENNGVSWREHKCSDIIKSKTLDDPMELKIFERDFTPTPESIGKVVETTVGGMGKEDKVEANEDAIEEIIRSPSLEQSRAYYKSKYDSRLNKKIWNDEHKIRDYLQNDGHKWDRGSWSGSSKNNIIDNKRKTPEDGNNINNNEDIQIAIINLAETIAKGIDGGAKPTPPPPEERKECEVCNSCGTPLVGKGYTKFKCTNCEFWIGRCRKCRTNSRKYLCGTLDNVCFEGP